ncbi:glycosyltransferase [Carnobacterium divergens]|uniref:glycosyltransferase n=1 Tax=Carnobacterium divergens TaxID=2748 RepID=UPI0039AF0731
MKILEVATFKLGACGPTEVLIPIIKNINIENEHSVDVFSTLTFDEKKEKKIKSLNANYFYKQKNKILSKKEIVAAIPDFETYDLIHIHGVYNIDNIMIAKLAYQMNIPYVITTHGNLMEESLQHSKIKKKAALFLFIKKFLSHAECIHALSNKEKKDIEKIIKHKNIEIIPNGIELLENSYKKENGIKDDKISLLFIGRIDIHHKGIDILIDSLLSLEENLIEKYELYLVGPYDGHFDEEYIKSKIKENPILESVIKIEGPKYGNEKEVYYEKADIFVHTSRYEGMPIAVLEAISQGLPILVTPETNLADIVEQSKNGFITSANVKEVEKSLIELNTFNKMELRELGKRGKNWASLNLSWNIISKKYLKMYSKYVGD